MYYSTIRKMERSDKQQLSFWKVVKALFLDSLKVVLVGLFLFALSPDAFSGDADDNLKVLEDSLCDGRIKLEIPRYDGGNKIDDWIHLEYKASDGSWKLLVKVKHWDDGGNVYSLTPQSGMGIEDVFSFNPDMADYSYYGWELYWNPGAGGASDMYNQEVTIRARETTEENGTDSDPYELTVHPLKPEAPTNLSISENGNTKLDVSWSDPSNLDVIESSNNFSNYKYQLYDVDAATSYWAGTNTSYSLTVIPGQQVKLQVRAVAVCTSGDFNGEYSSEATGGTTAPEVTKPAGLKATTDRCDGRVIVSWDYTGAVEPKNFILTKGSTEISVASDKREYIDNIGAHTLDTYMIKAVGDYNTSDNTSSVTGVTFGAPGKPAGFYASRNVNQVSLGWSDTNAESKYLIVRNSTSGSAEFELEKDATNFTDQSVAGCELYTYELFAANSCTEDIGIAGIKADAKPTITLTPSLGGYITSMDASKAYYPDKVLIEWSVQNNNLALVDNFEISRRNAGTGSFELLGSVSGVASYEDKTATGGLLYEYQLVAKLNCASSILSSNTRTATGFRLPYGIVNGHIEYESGVAVKGAEVLAEKSNGSSTGNSLLFNGSASVYIPNDSKLNPSSHMLAEAWINPSSLSGTKYIIDKYDGSNGYRVYQVDNDLHFVINVNGSSQTVSALDVLTIGEYTHVAGSYDSTGVRIYINGKIPSDLTFQLTAADMSDLNDMGIESDIISSLGSVQDVVYTTYTDFETAIIGLIDEAQAQRNMPLIMPVAKIEEYKPGATILTSGDIYHTGSSLVLGSSFSGNIDEVRIWSIAIDEEQVGFDYKRIVGNDAQGIAGYWRFDENFGNYVYDASKSMGLFHKNDGSFSGGVSFNSAIPNASQLGWVGVTNAEGDYTIPYIPYFGTGENFTITPRFGQHQFKPGSGTVFLGEGANILNGQDFEDVSSFKLTGTVFYEDTYCGVEAVIITVDGDPVIKNGTVIMTNQTGEFEISVPVGYHYVSVLKNGHDFKSFKFPPGPTTSTFNFQEDIIGVNFIDQTKVKIVGRVVGGSVQSAFDPGLGLSKNNIGVANFTFESVTGPACSSYSVVTDSSTGEYAIEVPPMKFQVKNFTVPKNPLVDLYFVDLELADFSLIAPDQLVTYTHEEEAYGYITVINATSKAYIEIEGKIDSVDILKESNEDGTSNAVFMYKKQSFSYKFIGDTINKIESFAATGVTDSCYYQYVYDLTYRSVPEINILSRDGISDFTGEQSIAYEDRVSNVKKKFDVATNPFLYPVFDQWSEYTALIVANEVYLNQDVCSGLNGCPEATLDYVPVNGGEIQIYNELALEVSPANLTFTNGKAVYNFMGGTPNIMEDVNFPYRSYSNIFNVTAIIDGNGYPWKPFEDDPPFPHPDDKYFRGYVLGSNPIKGSDFVTSGPAVVEIILRDPPGSESYSFLEKGSTFTTSQSLTIAGGSKTTVEANISLGVEFEAGLGYSVETEIKADLDIGASIESSWSKDRGFEKSITFNNSWQTSQDPELTGHLSDLFCGSSSNYTISLANNLTVFTESFASGNGIVHADSAAGSGTGKLVIGRNKSLMAAPEGFSTYFIYSLDHIQNYLIPFLKSVRNSLFIQESDVYVSNISIGQYNYGINGVDMYGANNDDKRWLDLGKAVSSSNYIITDPADITGVSYTFTAKVPGDIDEVRKYNEQIRLWEEALARNEMEKYNATLIKNISFDAGPTFEQSTETNVSSYYTSAFELALESSIATEISADVGGIGGGVKLGLETHINTGRTNTSSAEYSNTYGYVLHDPDQGDYFSVDVKDPGTGTGPVFAIKGGRSMCPYEDELRVEYYTPATHTITDSIITLFDSLQIDDALLKVLAWDKKGKFTPSELDALGIDYEFVGSVNFAPKVEVPKIKDQRFKKTVNIRQAVYAIADLGIDLDDGIDPDSLKNYMDSPEEYSAFSAEDNKIYFFTDTSRTKIKEEFERYRSYIYDLAAEPSKDPNLLSEATIRREVPKVSITPSVQTDIPDDNKAYFTASFGNNSYTGDDMWYEAQILEASNPDGAVILIDGIPIERTYEIGAGTSINKTITVEIGKPDVFDYEDLKLVLYSPCEWQYHADGMIMPPEAIDTVTFSVHFVPSCSDIDVVMPDDMFVINSNDEKLVDGAKQTKVPIILSGYDLNNSILEKLTFQYKALADPDWITASPYYKTAPNVDDNEIPGAFTGLEWDLSGFPDGQYMIRGKTYCGASPTGSQIFDLSEVWTGTVDRKPPKVFGSPQPADGILSPDDNVLIAFNETIYGEKLTNLENFSIRGILNGTDIRHDVSVRFDDDENKFVRIPDGINLADKSFTVEFWLKPERSFTEECIFSQSTNDNDAIYIGLNNQGKLIFKVAFEQFEVNELSVMDIVNEWHHFAFVYDDIRKEAIVMMDGSPISTQTMNATYSGFGDIYLGKSLIGQAKPLQGNIHELRIWERPRTASKITSNMLINLSGKETGLIGYWPLDETYGVLATDKVHKRNATVNAKWDITPSGYACSFDSYNSGLIDLNFSDIAFTQEQDFSVEFWFKSNDGADKCFISNGHGDEKDMIVYYISPEVLAQIVKVLPLEDSVAFKLSPLLNQIFSEDSIFLDEVAVHLGETKTDQYREQILRFAKIPPTYWCINTDASGFIQINNNVKRIKIEENVFDNSWHHFALVVERVGNSRVYLDGELKISEPSTEWNGLGAARLFIGARGLYNQHVANFEFDQYFNGEMDEVRIWSTALKQTQIQRNSTMRMDGDELGLVSYFPFETYEEIMGIPVVNGYIGDQINPRDYVLNQGVFTQNTNVPNVRMKRPSSKVDFGFVYREDEVAFVINEPIAKIENCILDITAQDIQDMYGNKMNSPVTWSAFVDMNQVKWDEQQFDLEKQIYAQLSFTATIRNNSGKQQNFSIENLPGWLTAEPREGTLEPLTYVEITFTVNEGANIGRYSRNIHLQTDFDFDEKLLVNLRVYEELPDDWKVNPEDFEHSMNIIGMVRVNNVVSTDRFDKVAAFVDGKCRGKAGLKYIPEYDLYEVFLDVYSNQVAGEYFELHFWDASTGREYRQVSADGLTEAPVQFETMYEFIDNTVHGSPSSPVQLVANNIVIQKIPLSRGWNWKSFNIEMDKNKPLSHLLEGIVSEPGDIIKGLTSYSEYSTYWIGTLNILEPEEMYMFRTGKSDTLKVSGIPVEPQSTPINIVEGWNWIGYTPQVNIEINNALGLFTPNHGDLLKSQFAFSMYDQLMGWVGTLSYLTPNQGYKYKYIPLGDAAVSQVLFYPEEGTLLKSAGAQNGKPIEASIPDWSIYQVNMPLVALLDGVPEQKEGDVVFVYSEGELRGEASPVRLVTGQLLYFITIYGNQVNDKLEFRYANSKNEQFEILEELEFNATAVEGSLDQPFILTVNSKPDLGFITDISCNIYPNPFNNKFSIVVVQPEDSDVEIEIFNVIGERIDWIRGLHGKDVRTTFEADFYLPGVYLVKISTGGEMFFRKMIKE